MRKLLVAGSIVSLALLAACATRSSHEGAPAVALADKDAGAWRAWVLKSGQEMRLPGPPDAAATAIELQEVRALASQRDAAAAERIRYWDFQSPSHRWNDVLIDINAATPFPGGGSIRAIAMLNIALHDAMIAAWDSKYAYNRQRPAAMRPAADERSGDKQSIVPV